MALQYSVAVRNARLDAIEAAIGASPLLRIRTGAPPASLAAAATGTILAEIALPADWMQAAAAGSKAKAGTWEDASANAGGTAGHFEIVSSDGTVRHIQGTVSATGGGGDMTVDNVNFAAGQAFSVTGFTITSGNA